MNRVLKWIVGILGVLVGLVVLLVIGVMFNANRQLNARYANPVQNVTVDRSPERVARGQHLVDAFPGCAGCHASNPAASPPMLDGNHMVDLEPLGQFYAMNLTPGGPLKDWSDGEIIRAIREGMDKNGRPLVVMPSEDFHVMSDDDAQAIVAYLRSQPALTKETPPVLLSFLGNMLLGTGQVSLSNRPPAGQVTAPPAGPTQQYGEYLVRITGCRACHGPTLDGTGQPPGPPPGPTLRVVKGWTPEQFMRTLREGVDPGGHQLDPDLMPWRQFAHGTDDELLAVYEYLRSL